MPLFPARRQSVPPLPTPRQRQRNIARGAWLVGMLGTLGIGILVALATSTLGP